MKRLTPLRSLEARQELEALKAAFDELFRVGATSCLHRGWKGASCARSPTNWPSRSASSKKN